MDAWFPSSGLTKVTAADITEDTKIPSTHLGMVCQAVTGSFGRGMLTQPAEEGHEESLANVGGYLTVGEFMAICRGSWFRPLSAV